METMAPRNKYDVLMKYKSKKQKQQAIDKLIDLILNGSLDSYELEEAKEDAATLASSLLRAETKK